MATLDTVTDDSWTRQAFLLPADAVDDDDIYYRNHSSAYFKYTDTTLGGNWALNAPPQPCLFSDPVLDRYVEIGEGQGAWYSENIDDNSVLLHMRFGVPNYNSLASFFGNFYSSDDARLVRTGRASGVGNLIGRAIGWAFSVRLVPFIMTFTAIKWFTGTVSTKFYYLKPTMGLYWKYVNDFANNIASNLDLAAKPTTDSWLKLTEGANLNGTTPMSESGDPGVESIEQATKTAFEIGAREKSVYDQMVPELFRADGLTGIDIYATATRAQAYANAWHEAINEIAAQNQSNGNGVMSSIYAWMTGGGATASLNKAKKKTYATTEEFLNAYLKDPDGRLTESPATAGNEASNAEVNTAQQSTATTTDANGNAISPVADNGTNEAQKGVIEQAYESVKDYFTDEVIGRAYATFKAAQRDGSQWLTLRIDGRESASESFSNSVRESDLQSTINSTSSRAASMRFSMAEGNFLGIPGMQEIVNTVKDIAGGIMDSLHISGVGAIAGNAFVDIPKHYDSSSASFNQMSLTIPLRAWAGDNFNRFQCEILPLITMLVGALPRATGTGSYTAPFIGEFYCQGRCSIPLGMITAIDITRATSNMPWTKNGEYLGIDVRLTITDLSSVAAMNLNEAFGLRNFDPTTWNRLLFPQDSSFEMYTNVLSSLGLHDQIYMLPRFKRNWNRVVNSFDRFFSYSNLANTIFSGNMGGQILSALSKTDRGL
ncbi:hypothetical protein MOA67_gp119 [Klebsiella phage KpLz-2_45]|uniref:hypothetical protein n=1 Tax=Klebsiella phage KpLz-2_45 TaxID=2698923 RepID=UPI001F13E746|nr:hypothetical protein MOA67_gp119 [Klebsiella phage KpLz-2_45]UKS71985.1 hypothetical protein KpLz245_1190 [Klebsiella phage KpLz-2_45]